VFRRPPRPAFVRKDLRAGEILESSTPQIVTDEDLMMTAEEDKVFKPAKYAPELNQAEADVEAAERLTEQVM